MKSSLRPPRSASWISDRVRHQLDMYALAASAAGVGIVALAQLAEARIVYTRTHQVVGLYGQYDLDLNHDKIVDYILSNNSNCTVNCWQWLSLRPATLAGNAVISARSYVVAMAKGSRIGSGDHFRSVTGVDRMLLDVNGTQIFGSWYDVTNRYAGLSSTSTERRTTAGHG